MGADGFTVTDRDAAFKKLKQMSPAEPAKTNWNRYGDVLEQKQTQTETKTETETE
jgi:hypothetical protein